MHVKSGSAIPSSVGEIQDSIHLATLAIIGGVLRDDGMSLFQDLKLKRRKVDSRCSSDGESICTSDSTASLSPDAPLTNQGDTSPKNKERCTTPEELHSMGRGGLPAPFPQQTFIFMVKPDRDRKQESKIIFNHSHKSNGVIKHLTNGLSPPTPISTNPEVGRADVLHVKAEPSEGGIENGHGHSTPPRTIKSSSPEEQRKCPTPITNGHGGGGAEKSPTHSNSSGPEIGQDGKVSPPTTNGVIKSERSLSLPAVVKTEKEAEVGEHSHPSPITSSSFCMSPPPLRITTSPTIQQTNSNSSSNFPHSPSPSTLIITKQQREGGRGGQRSPQNSGRESRISPPLATPHLQMHILQNHLHTRLTGQSGGPMVSMPSAQHQLDVHRNEKDPLPVVTSTSLSFNHQSMYRINGVRPEVISGGAVATTATPNTLPPPPPTYTHSSPHTMPNGHAPRKSPTHSSQHSRSPNSSPQSNSSSSGQSGSSSHLNGSMHSPMHGGGGGGTIVAGGSLGISSTSLGGNSTGPGHHHHVNLNRTPTVIMGEAGGVRTMLWSQPGQNLPSELGLSPLSPLVGSPPGSVHGHYGIQQNGHGGQSLSNGSSSSSSSPPHINIHLAPPPPNHHHASQKGGGGLSMERLWATEALNLSTAGNGNGNGSNSHSGGSGRSSNGSVSGSSNNHPVGPDEHLTNGHEGGAMNGHTHLPSSTFPHPLHGHPDEEDYEQPMICMICEDRATGLHYGIITCEGCKGFFKRTVQNRRVYTCVADGTCEITKAQRNRCQYCRFKKCIEQGMVLQAVREDRMPGGRNSGAVYNLYKVPVKYRKHKKGNRGGGMGGSLKVEKVNGGSNGMTHLPPPAPPPQAPQGGMSGTILKAALTNPNEVNHFRSSLTFDQSASMITHLVQCDNFHDIAALQNWEELLEARGDLSDKLCQMGDSIVYRLVQWTKRLPFYAEVPVEVHTRVLTHKWHELLVLTTSAWQAMNTSGPPVALTVEEETMDNLQILQRCLQAMMGRSLTLEQLRQDVGQMVERLTFLTRSFRRLGIRIEEYVTLKVIAMLQNTGTKSPEVTMIQERYVKCLRTFLEVTCPGHPNRLSDLLRTLPEVQAAASLLLESKMFYVPFLLNSALIQR